MIIIYCITIFIISIYILYPFWLSFFSLKQHDFEKETEEISSVSVIMLTCNGGIYLHDKIKFLINDLSDFEQYELIVIDDNSNDGSKEILESFRSNKNVKIILKDKQKGIPDSMNIGIKNAHYEYIIFCDQRQSLSPNILKRIVEPLKYKNVGAVSGCIYHIDKKNKHIIRNHENFIKILESKSGSLIGVYGPLYSIKKSCYIEIPQNIILDDLYLSLHILKTKQILIREDCHIIDDDFAILYDYNRTKRYLNGFIQILKDKSILNQLKIKHKVMLIWHKYIRLFIPFFLNLSYISSAFMIFNGVEYIITFCFLTTFGIITIIPINFKYKYRLQNILRMNNLYFFGLIDIFLRSFILYKKKENNISIND